MNTVDRIKSLCKERKVPVSRLEKECGFANGYIGQLKKGTVPADRLVKIADFFGVTPEYLMTGEAPDGYYINPETAKKAQEIFDTPGMAALFDAAKDSRPEDLQMAADMLRRLKSATLHLDDDVQ